MGIYLELQAKVILLCCLPTKYASLLAAGGYEQITKSVGFKILDMS